MFTKLSLAIALASALAAGAPPTKREAAVFQQKIDALRKEQKKRRTIITENELNAYFIHESKDLPVGVVNPSLTVLGPNRVSGRAVVDLDAVRKASPPASLLDPKNFLIGRVPLSATAVFTSSNGMGKFALESAKMGSLPLPKLLLDEIVSYYTRSESRPSGYTTESPFPLPIGIREIQITPRQAVIIQ